MIPFRMKQTTDWERWRASWFWGKEPETIAWIEGMKAGNRMWDVGANIGVYSLYAASRGVRVYAFEPSLKNRLSLEHNKNLNDFKNLTIVPVALSGRNGVSVFNEYFEAGMSGNQIGEGGRCCLERRGDDVGVPGPAWMKIDTDGNEWDVLRGCEETLRRVSGLCVEVNDFNIFSWLKSRGFVEDISYTRLKRKGGLNVIFKKC